MAQNDTKKTSRLYLEPTFQEHLSRRCPSAWSKADNFYRAVDLEHCRNYRLKLQSCRCYAWYARNVDTDQVRVLSRTCGLRWCPLCSQARRTYVSRSVAAWIKTERYSKFLTLTLKHSDDSLNSQIDRLNSSFVKLRSSKFFRTKVPAGVWFLQIKRSKDSGQWHSHLHCIISGQYLPQGKLSKLWLKITGDSKVVDIRLVKDPEKAANEVARYASSPANIETANPDDYLEIFNALHKRKVAGTWGLKGKVRLSRPAPEKPGQWENIGSWGLVRSQQGDGGAADAILKAWQRDEPLEKGITLNIATIEAADRYEKGRLSSPVKYYTDLFDVPP